MFILYTIVGPDVKIYLVDDNHFSMNKNDAKPFKTREEAMQEQNKYIFDTQIESVE